MIILVNENKHFGGPNNVLTRFLNARATPVPQTPWVLHASRARQQEASRECLVGVVDVRIKMLFRGLLKISPTSSVITALS